MPRIVLGTRKTWIRWSQALPSENTQFSEHGGCSNGIQISFEAAVPLGRLGNPGLNPYSMTCIIPKCSLRFPLEPSADFLFFC